METELVFLEDLPLGEVYLQDLLHALNASTRGVRWTWTGEWCQTVEQAHLSVQRRRSVIRAIVCDAQINDDSQAGIQFAQWARGIVGSQAAIVIWSSLVDDLCHHCYQTDSDILLHSGSKARKASFHEVADLIQSWLDLNRRVALTRCWTPSQLTPQHLLVVGFGLDVEQQLERAGYRLSPADESEEALEEWNEEDYDLLLIAPAIMRTDEDTEATKEASEELESQAIRVSPNRRSRILRIPSEHGDDIETILAQIERCLSQDALQE